MNEKKATVEAISAIPPRKSEVFNAKHPRDFNAIKALAYYTHSNYPELGVRFSCKCNTDTMTVKITANPISNNSKK